MALRWRRDMDDVRARLLEQALDIAVGPRNPVTLGELTGHKFFAIAHTDDFASRDRSDERNVIVRNLATPDDSDSHHRASPACLQYSKNRVSPTSVGTLCCQPS